MRTHVPAYVCVSVCVCVCVCVCLSVCVCVCVDMFVNIYTQVTRVCQDIPHHMSGTFNKHSSLAIFDKHNTTITS